MERGNGMEYTLDLGPWNAVFAVPCALVDRHIKLAGKEHLQAVLWILRHAGDSFSPEILADSLGMSVDSARDALQYWEDQGLLVSRKGQLQPVPQQEAQKPLPSPWAEPSAPPEKEPEPAPAPKAPPKKRMAKPDAAYLAARIKESESIRSLFQEAEAALGILSPAMTSVLLASCDDYGLPVEVVVMLLHYAKEVGKTSTAYIDSVARDWAASGVFTLEAAEAKLQELSEKRLAWSKVSSAAGLQKRSPSKKEEDAAYRWVYEWKFSPDMLSAAYEECVDHTGKFSTAYMNKVLGGWHEKGIRSRTDLEQSKQQREQQKQDAKSYDIDELERLSFFDLPEDL